MESIETIWNKFGKLKDRRKLFNRNSMEEECEVCHGTDPRCKDDKLDKLRYDAADKLKSKPMTWQERFDKQFKEFAGVDGLYRPILPGYEGQIKSFLQQEIDRAREEGRHEGVEGKFYEKITVESEIPEEFKQLYRQDERTRILKLIEEINLNDYMEPDVANDVLQELKNKLNDQS